MIVRALRIADFQRNVKQIAEDAERRARIGSLTKASIEATNTGHEWSRALAGVYDHALKLPERVRGPVLCDTPCFDDVDVFWRFVYGDTLQRLPPITRLTLASEAGLKLLPRSSAPSVGRHGTEAGA